MKAVTALLLVLWACPLAGQWQRNSSVSSDAKTQRLRIAQGKIVAEDNRPIPGATITIENPRRLFRREVRSDARGHWRTTGIQALTGEEFHVRISAPGCLTRRETIRFMGEKAILHSEMHPDPRLQALALFTQAAPARSDQRYSEALSYYERILVIDMDNANARLGAGICQLRLGLLAPAEANLRQVLSRAQAASDAGGISAALEHLGDLAMLRSAFTEAWECFTQALAMAPERLELKEKLDAARSRLRQLPEAGAGAPQPPAQPAEGRDAAAAGDERLTEILRRAAEYCRRLKGAAFKYFCTEAVEEEFWPGRPNAGKNQYQYDFQIVGRKRTLYEQRILQQENGRRVPEKKTGQKTLFQTSLMFFSPIDLFAIENQPLFSYRLLGAERVGDRDGWLLEVHAKQQTPGMPLLEGRVLLGSQDGAVMRIEVAPTAIIGVAERRTVAAMEGYPEIEISNVHWYDTEKNGLRFPSRSEMREIYVVGGMRTLHYGVTYAYANYRFFQVDMEVMDAHEG